MRVCVCESGQRESIRKSCITQNGIRFTQEVVRLQIRYVQLLSKQAQGLFVFWGLEMIDKCHKMLLFSTIGAARKPDSLNEEEKNNNNPLSHLIYIICSTGKVIQK